MSLPEVYQALQGQALYQPPKVAEVPLTKPGPNQVLIKIAFAPINPSDIGTILGVYGESKDKVGRSVGLEGSGVVAAVGQDLKVPHKVGDRVHVTGPGTMAQYLLSNSESVYPVQQDDLPLEEAACHFVNPGTVAYMGAKIEQGGHKAAIHTAGSSALGKMLIKYLKPKGIKLINIVRRDEYIEELKKEGADFVLNSQAPDFEEKLKELANKEQATIAFDAIAGDLTGKIVSALPSESQVYVYGLLSGQPTITLTTRESVYGQEFEWTPPK